ncbi:hypothetical protein COHA_010555 [Chlorella ohadii]|uniref:Uncharacterized protein n=1 Tax=Chlorella ohadii TaxID=2649997 RepID=A0AAD5GWV9_9CHLO|nr:hypothetical protein COHA_010555 [Chlorella ohadii]
MLATRRCLAWDQPCTSTFPPKTLGCDTNIAYYQCQASAESPGPAYGLCIYRDVSGSSSSVFPTLRTCCLGGHAGIANRCAPQGVSLGSCLEIVCTPFQDLCSTCDPATQVNACSDTVNTRPDGEINCPDPSRCCDNQCLDPAPQPNGAECCGSANNCAAGLVCSATFGRGTCGPVV